MEPANIKGIVASFSCEKRRRHGASALLKGPPGLDPTDSSIHSGCRSRFLRIVRPHKVPATALIAASVNFSDQLLLVICLSAFALSSQMFKGLAIGETLFFTFQAPITALSMSVIPVHTRARGSSLQILLCHVLGDVHLGTIRQLRSPRVSSKAILKSNIFGRLDATRPL